MLQFGEKIKAARKACGLTQKALAEKIGVTSRSIQLYESNSRQPKNATTIIKLANALGVETEYFLSEQEIERIEAQEAFLAQATDQFGTKGRVQAQLLLNQTSALFAGGTLDAEAQDAFFQTISEIYFDAKKRAAKYRK